jgi:methyl-accepting chemotaxis protein
MPHATSPAPAAGWASFLRPGNIPVLGKLVAAMLMLLALMGGIAATALSGKSQIGAATDEVADKWLPAVGAIGDVRYSVARHRILLNRKLLMDAPEQIARVDGEITDKQARIERQLSEYAARMGSSTAERDRVSTFRTNWQTYLRALEPFAAASRRNDNAAATAALFQTYEAYAAMTMLLDQIDAYNEAGAKSAAEAADAAVAAGGRLVLGMLAAAVLLALGAGIVLFVTVARPLGRITTAMAALASGKLDIDVPTHTGNDEIGRMTRALTALRETCTTAFRQGQMIEQMPVAAMTVDPKNEFRIDYLNAHSLKEFKAIEHLTKITAEQLKGSSVDVFHGGRAGHIRALLSNHANLPHSARIKIGGETLELRVNALTASDGSYQAPMLVWSNISKQMRMADSFEANVGGVVQSVASASGQLKGSAETLSSTAQQTSVQAGAVAAATEEASANVQTVAASSEELSASISEISRQVSASAQIAAKAVAQAQATNAKIEGLSAAATQIGDVVKLIGEIASKTNLLALNATIEAARAGEAGKGFAVVAAEVKTLATQTARATEEIGAKVAEMQGATAQSVASIQAIGEVIGEISGIATSIASAVEQQGAATAEIARNVQEAARGTQEVASNITGVTQASGETGTAANQMLGAANELSQQAETLRTEVAQFLTTVRAA